MPDKETLKRARRDARQGKSASTQAGQFVREEIHHVREGKHGVRSPRQAIAIGLSKARRAGVELEPPEKGRTSSRTRSQAARDLARGRRGGGARTSSRRSRAARSALKGEGHRAAAPRALARQARAGARRRPAAARSAAARRGARTRARRR